MELLQRRGTPAPWCIERIPLMTTIRLWQTSKELEQSSATKQDKGSSGYLAQFDGTGNPISSKKKVSDFATSEQGERPILPCRA